MKLLLGHISDTHLGASPYSILERERDFYDAFEEAVDVMVKDHVDAVIHAGDVFDAPKPGGSAMLVLLRGFRRLADSGARIFFTLGEHDISRMPGTPSPLLFSEIGLATYVGDGMPHRYNGITVTGFHKHRRSEIDSLRDKLAQLGKMQEDGKRVLVLHQGLAEFHQFAGEMTQQDLPRGFDYYAMGHLHDKNKALFDGFRGPVCYPGSIESTSVEGIREREKGFYLVDLSGETASTEWVRLRSVRPQFRTDIRYEDISQAAAALVDKVKGLEKKPMLDITVRGKDIDRDLVSAALRQLCDLALYCQRSVVDEAVYTRELQGKPADIDSEMMETASRILGNSEAASFAINELLPALYAGNEDEAAEMLWSAFKKGRAL
ncbi:MAG: DNA repair exonuclease [Nitrososphaerota archaeon]|nr:DNA repair exonuclease [Nitrososphaerota archaeon]